MLADKIEKSEDRDAVFETLGLQKSVSKKRTTKEQLEQIKQVSTQDYSNIVMEVDAAEAIKEIGDVDSDLPLPYKELLTNFTIEGIA